MSKATSLNKMNMDMNVSQEVENVLAEIESSKNNQIPQQLPQMVQQTQDQVPPQYQTMPPNQGQQLPPPNVGMMPDYYAKNFPTQPPSSGIMDFFKNMMIVGDEFKWVGVIAGLFLLMNLAQTKNMLGKYLKFTINELGDSTIIGIVARGLILGLIFVIVNKFI